MKIITLEIPDDIVNELKFWLKMKITTGNFTGGIADSFLFVLIEKLEAGEKVWRAKRKSIEKNTTLEEK